MSLSDLEGQYLKATIGEKLDFSLKYDLELGSDVITQSSWQVPVGITQLVSPPSSFTSTTTTIWLQANSGGEFTCVNTIVSAGGRTFVGKLRVKVDVPTFTYNDVLTTDIDKVRFYCGDTDAAGALVKDQEILFAISEEGDVRNAAALVCEHLSARFSRSSDKQVGDLRISFSQRSKAFADKARALRGRALVLAVPSCGGLSQSLKDVAEENDDRVQPSFAREMMEDESLRPIPQTTDEL